MCAAAAKTGRHMVADTPSSNTLSIIKRKKEFQEDPYAGQSRYKHKLKRPSVFFCSIATVDIPAGVNPSTKCMAAGQMADTIRTHGRFFFFVLSSPVMQQAGSVWESQPGRVGCGAKLFSLFPRLQMACPAADCLLYNIQ